MFNKTVIVAGRPADVHHHTTVKEVRAPTDESVRLLKEMEQKAEEKVLKAMRLESNGFKAVIQKQHALEVGDDVYVVVYELNGVRHTVKVHYDGLQSTRGIHWTQIVLDELSEDIARNILQQALNDVPKDWR